MATDRDVPAAAIDLVDQETAIDLGVPVTVIAPDVRETVIGQDDRATAIGQVAQAIGQVAPDVPATATGPTIDLIEFPIAIVGTTTVATTGAMSTTIGAAIGRTTAIGSTTIGGTRTRTGITIPVSTIGAGPLGRR